MGVAILQTCQIYLSNHTPFCLVVPREKHQKWMMCLPPHLIFFLPFELNVSFDSTFDVFFVPFTLALSQCMMGLIILQRSDMVDLRFYCSACSSLTLWIFLSTLIFVHLFSRGSLASCFSNVSVSTRIIPVFAFLFLFYPCLIFRGGLFAVFVLCVFIALCIGSVIPQTYGMVIGSFLAVLHLLVLFFIIIIIFFLCSTWRFLLFVVHFEFWQRSKIWLFLSFLFPLICFDAGLISSWNLIV